MTITFDEIPSDWLAPGNFLEVKPNYRTLGVLPWPVRNLIIAQKLAAGTLAPGQIVEITRPEEAIALFGLGSIGAEMVASFRKANKTQPLFVMALADAGDAVKATGTFTFTGAVPQPVVLRFRVGGRQVRITAAPADTTTQLATKLAAAITADTASAVTAASALGVVTCTARHGGEAGNDIDLRVDVAAQAIPAGLTVAIAAMAGGTGNPDITDALDLLPGAWYTDVSFPWNDATNVQAFATWAIDRFKAMSRLDVHGYVAKRATYGQAGTFGQLTNCPFLSAFALKASPSSSWTIAAAAHAIAAFHLTNDPARQLRSLVLPGVMAPDPADLYSETENELLLRSGVSMLECLPDGTVTLARVITTYRTSTLGIADRAWLDIMVPKTMSRVRYDWRGYMALMYPRAKLIEDESEAAFATRDDDDEEPGNTVASPRRVHGSWAARCRLYAQRAWLTDVERTIKESRFEIDDDDRNRLNSRQQVVIVGNLMVSAGSLEFQV
ncbi:MULTISPECIES: phage tail sheath subtilisin-like domain-containing protein [unclassified Shinella]|uniref:phage tail sheath subtilisin-like domain-containing protein n=1 Tax=unclassified Shinella TaxID=2643062 RepID=UPI000AEF5918|nr:MULTISPECIES: phage tail sheath subtilisin-like domain-containing protein [unclassified Shinella]